VRVIAGTLKGRRLRAARGRDVRPTADRVKEALFSMLESRFDLAAGPVLDLFAGTGALGIEALSRGAPRVVFVEQDRGAREILARNLQACGITGAATVLPRPMARALRELAAAGQRFAGVLLDPPYGGGLSDAALRQVGPVLADDGWAAVEHHVADRLAETYGPLRLTVTRRYGNTALSVYASAQKAEVAVP
jgi:16S rRNA (guanine(966)-N(2))-methyltransferase RsmD